MRADDAARVGLARDVALRIIGIAALERDGAAIGLENPLFSF